MNRLECIKSMVSPCQTVADIGTDHGYMAKMLLDEKIAQKIIATDLNKGPLSRAVEYISSKGLFDQCDFRLGSGLTVLKMGEAQAVVIAGMGGDLISDIIEVSKDISSSTDQLILQPMTAVEKLRKYLYENGFVIIDEHIVKEFHHYYFIIKAKPGDTVAIDNQIYYEFSKHLIDKKDKLMYEYILKTIDVNNKIIQNLRLANNDEYNIKIKDLEIKNLKIKELIKPYEN